MDVEVVPSEKALPDHLLPLVQGRFECFAVPLFLFLFCKFMMAKRGGSPTSPASKQYYKINNILNNQN